VQARETGKDFDSRNKLCNPIKITPAEAQNDSEDEEEEEPPEQADEDDSPKEANPRYSTNLSFTPQIQPSSVSKIVLGAKSSPESEAQIFMTKKEKITLSIVCSFTILCVIIIILLALRQL
jgi:hypothetical protein